LGLPQNICRRLAQTDRFDMKPGFKYDLFRKLFIDNSTREAL